MLVVYIWFVPLHAAGGYEALLHECDERVQVLQFSLPWNLYLLFARVDQCLEIGTRQEIRSASATVFWIELDLLYGELKKER